MIALTVQSAEDTNSRNRAYADRTADFEGRSPFGHLLREFRLALNLSQEALAERAGLSLGGISALERGIRREPHRDTVALLTSALNLSLTNRERLRAAAKRVSRPRQWQLPLADRALGLSSTNASLIARESAASIAVSLGQLTQHRPAPSPTAGNLFHVLSPEPETPAMNVTTSVHDVATPPCVRLEVQFATGNVLVRGHAVKLSSTEHALLFSVARHRYPSTRDQLIDLVWGDSLGEKSQNAFNLALHRLRRRLGGNDSILHGSNGYSLCEGAVVDLAHLETLARSIKRASSISDQDLNSIGRIYEGWRRSAALISDRYEWLETTSHRARTLAAELGVAFGRGVLQRGDGAAALEIARDLLAADGCDESAAELAICTLLQRRDRSEALRVFRTYSESLQRELGLRPSHSVKALFEQTLTAVAT